MLLGGKPLCSYLFETITNVDEIDEKYVYCSDEHIANYLPPQIKFLQRNPCLDGPEVKGLEIIRHFVSDVDADIYVLTHVTQPFTRKSSLVEALNKVKSGEYDSAFSALELKDYCWYNGRPLNYDMKDIQTTQNINPVYMETGAFFIFKKEVFTKMHQRIGENPYIKIIDRIEAIDIDTADDFRMAEVAHAYLKDNNE